MANEDDELIKEYGKENVEDFRMWLTHVRLSCDPLTPYGWAQLSVEDKKKLIEILEQPLSAAKRDALGFEIIDEE